MPVGSAATSERFSVSTQDVLLPAPTPASAEVFDRSAAATSLPSSTVSRPAAASCASRRHSGRCTVPCLDGGGGERSNAAGFNQSTPLDEAANQAHLPIPRQSACCCPRRGKHATSQQALRFETVAPSPAGAPARGDAPGRALQLSVAVELLGAPPAHFRLKGLWLEGPARQEGKQYHGHGCAVYRQTPGLVKSSWACGHAVAAPATTHPPPCACMALPTQSQPSSRTCGTQGARERHAPLRPPPAVRHSCRHQ